MNSIMLIGCMLFSSLQNIKTPVSSPKLSMVTEQTKPLSIIFPKNEQKVRGDYKIYGKATPGATVRVTITSKYFKTTHDNRERISKGEGPIDRMNRKFTLIADRSGTWTIKNIELRNAGWEETFTIQATSEEKTVTIKVYDKVHPVRID